jgi:hypothetical protein
LAGAVLCRRASFCIRVCRAEIFRLPVDRPLAIPHSIYAKPPPNGSPIPPRAERVKKATATELLEAEFARVDINPQRPDRRLMEQFKDSGTTFYSD